MSFAAWNKTTFCLMVNLYKVRPPYLRYRIGVILTRTYDQFMKVTVVCPRVKRGTKCLRFLKLYASGCSSKDYQGEEENHLVLDPTPKEKYSKTYHLSKSAVF